ncbi:hypothetical protein RFI_24411, partial [Reticulomyxa filosa]
SKSKSKSKSNTNNKTNGKSPFHRHEQNDNRQSPKVKKMFEVELHPIKKDLHIIIPNIASMDSAPSSPPRIPVVPPIGGFFAGNASHSLWNVSNEESDDITLNQLALDDGNEIELYMSDDQSNASAETQSVASFVAMPMTPNLSEKTKGFLFVSYIPEEEEGENMTKKKK